MVFDREVFEAAVRIPETEPAFLELCAALGITVDRIQEHDEVAQAGKTYPPEVWRNLKFPIAEFPSLAQPGDTIFAGVPVRIWVRNRCLEIIIGPAVGP
jgi:hypothetical protein